MSDMRHLLETVTKFAGEPEQKPGDQVRGGEPMPRKGTKKHPHAGRLVGGESILRELEQQIVEGQVERRLREEFSSTVKSAADKIVAAGSATRDALSSAVDAIPRPFDEKTYQDRVVQKPETKTDWRKIDTKKIQERKVQIRALSDPNDPDNYDTIRFQQQHPDGSIIDIEPYSGSHRDYYRQLTGKEPGQSPTARAMTDTLVDLMQKPQPPSKAIPEPKQLYPQDTIRQPSEPVDDEEDDVLAEFAPSGNDDSEPDEEEILRQLAAQWWNGTEQQMAKAQKTLAAMGWEIGQDESGDDDAGVFLIRPGDVNGDTYIAFPHSELGLQEWGAAGTAVGPGNDDADPVEIAAQRAQQVAGKTEQHNQLAGLISQVNSARSQLADLNKQFPQGANPVEKAMSMQQQQAQRVQLSRQIEDLMVQVAALRSQA